MMMFLYLITGLAIGFFTGWLLARSRSVNGTEALNIAGKELASLQTRLNILEEQRASVDAALKEERTKSAVAQSALSKSESDIGYLKQQLEERNKELETIHQRLTSEFENVANRILDEKSTKFVEQNRVNLDVILNPLKEKIKEFENKVDKAYSSEAQERNTLRGEIKNLMELNQRINEEAENLTRALKGDTKKQGNWGEFILEKVLESSGLEKGREYVTQDSFTTEDGRKLQPDVVVYLPDNKHIVVDAKVSLVAYEAMVNAVDDAQRDKFMKEHLASLRNHIKGLSEKAYHELPGLTSPDFVLLFVPIESSFGVAVQADKDLFGFAWEKRIVIVSPSTLLATLRTIASVWKQDRQTKNALEIAKVGGGLYDKFKGFVDDLIDVGKKMESAKTSYNDAMGKLVDGNGNIVRRVEELKKLGAKTTKDLPQGLLDRATETPAD